MYDIDFRLPQTKFTTSQAQKITTKGVNEWLKKLDHSNNPKAQYFFLETLKKINRIELPVLARMEVMELLAPVSEAILSEIIHKTSITNTSLNEKHLELSEQIQYLLIEISVGYKLIIKDILDDEKLLSKHLGDILPKACYNATRSLSYLLIERYQKYLSEPSYIWFELNQIYFMAETFGIHDMELEENQTIINEYIRISVIHISDPYRLMPFEIRKIYRMMDKWAKYCTIEHKGKKHIKDYHIVGLTDKRGPNNAYANITIKKDNIRFFNLDRLKLHIKRKLEKNDDNHSKKTLPINDRLDKEMLLRFSQHLSYTGSQKEKRMVSNEKVSLIIGMTACHYFVRGEKGFDPEKEIQATLTQKRKKTGRYERGESLNLSLVSLDDDLGHDTSRIAQLRKINPFLSEDMLVDDNWDQINSSTAANAQLRTMNQTHTLDDLYREEIWEEKNTSSGGMLLLRSFQSSNILHVGMLIAYRRNFNQNSIDEKKYHLGIIRWLRININKGMAIGICYLTDQYEAVAVKALEGIGSGSDYNQAFLLKLSTEGEGHSQNYQNSLLVPSGIYDVNTILTLWYQGKEIKVRITQKLLTTKTLMQVKFEEIMDKEESSKQL